MMVWLYLLWISLIYAQVTTGPVNFQMDGFNMTSNVLTLNGYQNLDYYFYSLDNPTSIFTLRLAAVFEGIMFNGRVTQLGPNQLTTMTYGIPTTNPNPPLYYNFSVTATANPPAKLTGLQTFTLAYTYYLKTSNVNKCPDINGRFCVKFTITYNYIQTTQNTVLVFVWQLLANQIIATTMNPLPTSQQVLNNLGFFNVENTISLTDTAAAFPVQVTPVRLELRSDNITNNGIWAIYSLGTALNVKVLHDPSFGINNNGATLTMQIVTTALSIGIVLVFLVILGCSIFIYNGNTKDYYRKLRVIQETE